MTRENAVKGLLEVADWHYGKYEQTHEEDYLNDGDFLTAVANLLKSQEPVDAVPVVHGRWVIDTAFGNDVMSNGRMVLCSECGQGRFRGKTNYCPNCGAKMDGERRDES